MTTQLEFRLSRRGQSQNARLRAYLQAKPGQWLAMTELGRVIEAWAVHSRVADCRKRFGMVIEQRSRRHPETGKNLSEYRYVPAGKLANQ